MSLASRVLFATFVLALGCSSPPESGFDHDEHLRTDTVKNELSSIDCSESVDTGYTKGTPFPITVVTVDGNKAEKASANAYYVMAQAASAAGVEITVVDGFRTMAEQQYFWDCMHNCTSSCSSCNSAAAPGYSNHQSGHAFDLNTSAGGVYNWLNANGAAYGFSETVAGEPWHWEWWGGGPGGGPCSGVGPDQVVAEMGTLDGSPSSDVDGDGIADACVRSSIGMGCYTSKDSFATEITGPALSNADGWDKPEYFSTIRMGDIDGDGKADICGRAGAGIYCWKSEGDGFGEGIAGPEWSDAQGFAFAWYWSTIRLADVNGDGKADVCGRTGSDFRCHLANGTGFDAAAIIGPELSDASGWSNPEYYGTIRMADVNGDGKTDLCARSSVEFQCWLSDGNGFPDAISGPPLSDAAGWADAKYWSTLRMPDVNGDGKADVCGRSADGLACWLSDGAGFPDSIQGPELTDAGSWGEPQYNSTIRFADLNLDGKADLCARAGAGLACWLSDGAGFPDSITSDGMADASGWNHPEYYSTLRMVDVTGDGRADACARAGSGLVCWPFDGTKFLPYATGPEWKDESGWNQYMYYSTLQLVGGCVAKDEVCNERDDDCDGKVDEDGICDLAGGGGLGSGGPSGAGGSATSRGGTETDDAGCSCSAVQTTNAPVGLLLFALGLSALVLRVRNGRN